jgi:hypothetical protein
MALAAKSFGNNKVTIGATAARVEATGRVPCKFIWIRADSSNTGSIYFGSSTVVTNASAGGAFLNAGESIILSISDPYDLYCVGSAAGQIFYYTVGK